MRNLAPIGISTYSRLDHLKKMIKALQANSLAKESEVFIFSDFPKKGDEKVVESLRSYLPSIDGFKSVTIVERIENSRIKNNRGGVQQLVDMYGRCIFMEEDIVTAPGFLEFMNQALNFYQSDPKVLSITGYCWPINTESCDVDCYVLPRFNAWGMGVWKDTYEAVKYITHQEYVDFMRNTQLKKAFIQASGEDVLNLFSSEVTGQIDAYDVKAMFHQYKHNMFTVYPKYSLVQNIGHDSSGLHCGTTDKFWHKKLWDKKEGFRFKGNLQIDEKIRIGNFNFRKRGFKGRLADFSRKIGVYSYLKKIKNALNR